MPLFLDEETYILLIHRTNWLTKLDASECMKHSFIFSPCPENEMGTKWTRESNFKNYTKEWIEINVMKNVNKAWVIAMTNGNLKNRENMDTCKNERLEMPTLKTEVVLTEPAEFEAVHW